MEIELEKVGIDRDSKIISISTLNPVVVKSDEKISSVSELLAKTGHRSVPVVDKKMQLFGIVTITDILSFYLSGGNLDVEVWNIMSRDVISCSENESVDFVLKKMKISKRGRLPVVSENNKIVGIISETDFILSSRNVGVFDDVKIKDVMSKKPFFVQSSFTIKEVMRTMVNGKYRRLPVIDGGKLSGYITSTLLFKQLVENSFSNEFVIKRVSEIMTKNPITVAGEENLSTVLEIMKREKISSMLIVGEERVIEGIFTERDYINILC